MLLDCFGYDLFLNLTLTHQKTRYSIAVTNDKIIAFWASNDNQ